MDDGSNNMAESISLIEMQKQQGVNTVVATPHFHANDESVESFLDRRLKAYIELRKQLPENAPNIIMGAEVRYYEGISRLEGLKKLRVEGSKLLLLEMPMMTWTEYMLRELIEISSKSGVILVLAHIERYLPMQKQDVWDRLINNGVLMQCNASFFTAFTTKRKAVSLLREGRVHFIGSDCHSIEYRPPRIQKAFEVIGKRLGYDFLEQLCEYGYSLLDTNKI